MPSFSVTFPLGLFLLTLSMSSVIGIDTWPTPGCDWRPSCEDSDSTPCGPGTFFADSCWGQIYYECANGWPAPGICAEPMSFNPVSKVCDILVDEDPHASCLCTPSCAVPPECPTEGITTHRHDDVSCDHREGEADGLEECDPCNGTIVLPHPCDCQFYYECDALGIAHLRTCGQHEIFSPREVYSGTCVAVEPNVSEASACLNRKNLVVTFEPELPVAPVPLPERHPIHELLLKLNIPLHKIPNNLRQYTRVKFNSNRIAATPS